MRVPSYDQPQVRQAPLRIPNVDANVPAAAFGTPEQYGKIANSVASGAIDFAAKQKEDADKTAVRDYDTGLLKLQSSLQAKMSALRGKNAAGSQQMIDDEWQKGTAELDKMLVNREQRGMGLEASQSRYRTLFSQAQIHTAREMQAYNEESAKNHITLSQLNAAQNYNDPMAIAKSLSDQDKNLRELKESNGLDDAWLSVELDKAYSKTHADVIGAYLSRNDDIGADRYYRANKDEITNPDIRKKVDSMLEDGSYRGKSQRAVDGYLSQNLTMTEAREKAKEQYANDPKLREVVEARIKDEYAVREQAERVSGEIKVRGLLNEVDKTLALPTPEKMYGLSESQRAAVYRYTERARKGIEPVTDLSKYYDLKQMGANPETRDDFLKEDLYQHINDFSRADFKDLVNFQTNLRNKDSKGEAEAKGVLTDSQIINSTLYDMGIDPMKKNNRPKAAAFRRAVQNEALQYEERTGKKVSPQELQEISDRLAGEVVTDKGFFWDTKKRLFEVEEGVLGVDLEDIPRAERVKIESALKRAGVPVTDENVISVYQDRIGAK